MKLRRGWEVRGSRLVLVLSVGVMVIMAGNEAISLDWMAARPIYTLELVSSNSTF